MSDEEKILELLSLHHSTDGLNVAGLQHLAAHSEVQTVSTGDVLHEAGEAATSLLLILRGQLKLVSENAEENEAAAHLLRRDDQFGLLSLLAEQSIPYRVIADEDSTLLQISAENIPDLFQKLPLWRRNLMKSLGHKIRGQIMKNRPRTQTRIVAIFHTSEKTRSITNLIADQLNALDEKIAILTDDIESQKQGPATLISIIDERGALLPIEELRRMVVELKDYDRVFLDAMQSHAEPQLSLLRSSCDRLLWLVTPEKAEVTERLLSGQHIDTPELSKKQRWIWILEPDQSVAPFVSGLSEIVGRDFKLPFSQTAVTIAGRQRQGLHRIIHDLRNIRLGLAMGGGAARGMAHLGVLQALDAAGLVVDEISGTSVGAMVGCMYAAGMSPELTAGYFARDLTPSRLESALPKGEDLYLVRKYRSNEWDGMLRNYLEDWQFEQLVTPMNTVTVDLISASQVVRTGGDVVNAILESINLPGLSVPICRDGMALVDGGILNVLPADVLVNAGADYVIGVNVSSQLTPEFAGNRPDTPTEKMKAPNAFDTAVRMLMVQQKNMRKIGSQPADFTIAPDVSGFELSDFQHAVELAEIGRISAEENLSQLKKELESLDACLTLD